MISNFFCFLQSQFCFYQCLPTLILCALASLCIMHCIRLTSFVQISLHWCLDIWFDLLLQTCQICLISIFFAHDSLDTNLMMASCIMESEINTKSWLSMPFDFYLIYFDLNKINSNKIKIINIKKWYGHMAKSRARVQQCKLKTSENEWAHLAKFEVLGIVDFWQFFKKVQLQQCITSSILNFWSCSLTF